VSIALEVPATAGREQQVSEQRFPKMKSPMGVTPHQRQPRDTSTRDPQWHCNLAGL